jgi:hypothetical protein
VRPPRTTGHHAIDVACPKCDADAGVECDRIFVDTPRFHGARVRLAAEVTRNENRQAKKDADK